MEIFSPSYNMTENPRSRAQDHLHVLGGGKADCPGSRSTERRNDDDDDDYYGNFLKLSLIDHCDVIFQNIE